MEGETDPMYYAKLIASASFLQSRKVHRALVENFCEYVAMHDDMGKWLLEHDAPFNRAEDDVKAVD